MHRNLIPFLPCAILLFSTSPFHAQNASQTSAPVAPSAAAPADAWHVLYEENFEGPAPFATGAPAWTPDTHQHDDEFSDGGSRFPGVVPPTAYRIEAPFSKDGWLTVAAYSRSDQTKLSDLFSIVADPANPSNHVLRVASPRSSDGLVVHPTAQLPDRYRVCVRAGYASFGDGKPGAANLNGYAGGETAAPWGTDSSSSENGFYFLTILDATPRPHNNIWIHHHRKVVIDADNNKGQWTNIWEGTSWVADGRHPVTMFGLDKDGWDSGANGLPFLAYSHGAIQPSGEIRSVDAYKDSTWYTACVERNPTDFVLSISGDFKFGGQQTYTASIPIKLIYHAEPGIPDFFMFGDPHNNFYRGSIYYDDIKLEVPSSTK
ncbi:MAG TPA: hypothetical protein VN612_17515 [Acidobacteriaceae bacterium]|nr:hypothetical protein [Acidobacteriaceae bacterium]